MREHGCVSTCVRAWVRACVRRCVAACVARAHSSLTLKRNIGKKLGYNKSEDYYNLTQPLLHAHGGSCLLDHYILQPSPFLISPLFFVTLSHPIVFDFTVLNGVRETVTTLLPELALEPWKFNAINLWDSTEIRERYMQYQSLSPIPSSAPFLLPLLPCPPFVDQI